ncbi:unnamed protein product [Phaeothamnion confervicola]
MTVHRGFAAAFDSIKDQLAAFVEPPPPPSSRGGDDGAADGAGSSPPRRVLFVGHSLGGAIAQLAAAHFGHLEPTLVTFAAPAAGDAAFCAHVEAVAHPYGGLRVYNENDVVPVIAQLVGYRHAGVPVVQRVTSDTVLKFEAENINARLPGIAALAPHILFRLGPAVYAFPVLGTELPQ